MEQELNKKITALLQENKKLKIENEEKQKKHQLELDDVFCDIITIIDSFDKAENVIKERELDQSEDVQKVIKRLLQAKKRAISILDKYEIQQIEFENNMSNDNDCQITDTVPDKSKQNGVIVEIEKQGYRRHGNLLRCADVVIVKN